MNDDDLVDRFGTACLRAGKSNRGGCIDAMANSDWDTMQTLRLALKIRLAELR